MTKYISLKIDGRSIMDNEGTVIATISDLLQECDARLYANAFAASLDTLSLLEIIVTKSVTQFQQAYASAEEYNNRADVPTLRPRFDYPELPEEIKKGLAVIAKAKGDKQ